MKRFLKALVLFLLPVALLCGLCFFALIKSGELQPLETAVNISQNPDVLYGLAYRNDAESYKLAMAQKKSAQLMVIGTSRSMQLGQELFLQNSFYNAGGAAPKIEYFEYFLQSLPKAALPKKLIIVLDQNFFNPVWDSHDTKPQISANKINTVPFLQRFIQDIARGKINFAKIFSASPSQLGLSAIINGSGYAFDGSYVYGTMQTNPNYNTDKDFAETLAKINQGKQRFEYGSEVCPVCISTIKALTGFCSENGIQLVGIIPPYAPSVWQKMNESGNYLYIPKIYSELSPLFEEKGFELYDYTDFSLSNDEEYIDGYHGSDKTYCRIMLDMLPKTKILAKEIKPDLQSLLGGGSPHELS